MIGFDGFIDKNVGNDDYASLPIDRAREISKKSEKLFSKISGCFEKSVSQVGRDKCYDKDTIKAKLASIGFDLSDEIIDEYIKITEEKHKDIDELSMQARGPEITYSDGHVEYKTDKKAQKKEWDAICELVSAQSALLEEPIMEAVFNQYKDADANTIFEVVEASIHLQYNGNFGELEKQNPIISKYAETKRSELKLKDENKELREDNAVLENTNDGLRKGNNELSQRNEELKEENVNLKTQMKDIVQKVKEYKDFVLQTVREIPIIGKIAAKRITQKEKALPKSEVER